LSAAPCTAMVFVWSNLCKGDANFTLTQVALNDIIMIFAFAPIVGLLLGMTDIHVPWNTLFYSVLIYIIVPFVIAQTIRAVMLHQGPARLDALLKRLHPVSLIGLLAMLVLLFSFQGNALLNHPVVVLLIAVPIIIQVYSNSMLAYGLNKWVGEAHAVAGPSALIGASNFFELAVATAISVFGFHSGAALATVVGVLVEVPVMLSVVRIVMRSKGWFNQRH
jgi:ACR3 family arsenite transporter